MMGRTQNDVNIWDCLLSCNQGPKIRMRLSQASVKHVRVSGAVRVGSTALGDCGHDSAAKCHANLIRPWRGSSAPLSSAWLADWRAPWLTVCCVSLLPSNIDAGSPAAGGVMRVDGCVAPAQQPLTPHPEAPLYCRSR